MSTTATSASPVSTSRAALDALVSPVLVIDHAGTFVEANCAARQPAAAHRCRIFGGDAGTEVFARVPVEWRDDNAR